LFVCKLLSVVFVRGAERGANVGRCSKAPHFPARQLTLRGAAFHFKLPVFGGRGWSWGYDKKLQTKTHRQLSVALICPAPKKLTGGKPETTTVAKAYNENCLYLNASHWHRCPHKPAAGCPT
jgi:hypothetical protein